MWPTALQMSRDECRGVLRRLELESYSNVVSAFRAQGGISEQKAKILEELRRVFHISNDRHRAEARRAANDEQLSTIAECISGPNTYQDWCREGRRTYPLLPRAIPSTAATIIADKVAAEVAKDNSTLPYPSETVAETYPYIEPLQDKVPAPVVTKNPFLVAPINEPCLPIAIEKSKKTKRIHFENSSAPSAVSPNKRRNLEDSESSFDASSPVHPMLPMEMPKSQIQQLYQSHSKTQTKQKKAIRKSVATKRNHSPTKPHKNHQKVNESLDVSTTKPAVPKATTSKPQLSHQKPLAMHSHVPLPIPSTSFDSGTLFKPSSSSSETTFPDKQFQIVAGSAAKKDISKIISKPMLGVPKAPTQGKVQTIHMTEYESKTEKLSTPVQKYIMDERSVTIVHQGDPSRHIKIKPFVSVNNSKFTNLKAMKSNDSPTPINTTSPQIFNIVDSPNIVPNLQPSLNNKILSQKILPLYKSDLDAALQSPTNIVKNTYPIQKKINQVMTNIKMAPNMQLKNIAPSNRPSVKLISSVNGKMFIQTDNSKGIGKMSPVITAKGGLAMATTSGSASSGSNSGASNRISIQKIQIIQPPGKALPMTSKSMIFMPTNTSTSTGAIVKNLPLAIKSTKPVSPALLTNTHDKSIPPSKTNVIVIGPLTTASSTMSAEQSANFDANMITEDTPVDILTTPIIVEEEQPQIDESNNQSTTNQIEIIESAATAKRSESTSGSENIVIGATDWEMELDQEASKNRAMNAQINYTNSTSSRNNNYVGYECKYTEDNDGNTYSDDNYNDVIEEDHHIEVVDEDGVDRTAEVIQYDENYESVNEDIDDTIAVEYIEEDHNPGVYEQKIDSSTDPNHSHASSSNNIVYIKGQVEDDAQEAEAAQNSAMVSVEEISSTSQMESVQNDV